MALTSKTFRIFVSSTFSDLKAERNALQQNVFPKLRKLCTQNGFRFQAIDLRWGVREEAGLDQQTVRICLDEIARCQQTTPRPNFIAMLGNRYGWQPLPYAIEAPEFEALLPHVPGKDNQDLLTSWYKRDDNSVPPAYLLQPRKVDIPEGASYEETKATKVKESKEWAETELFLQTMLRAAIEKLTLTDKQKIKYHASATEREIMAGAMAVPDAQNHVFGFFRDIKDIPGDITAKDYIDLITETKVDSDAQDKLKALKELLEGKVGKPNIFNYKAKWSDQGSSTDHIKALCDDVYNSLSNVIQQSMDELEEKDPLEQEIDAHDDFGEDRARVFIGRIQPLLKIQDYFSGIESFPLAVWGESGSGKSALMARAVAQTQKQHPDAEIITRFVGATPGSSDIRTLLENLCRQISRAYGKDEAAIPTDYKELVEAFPKMLALATQAKPLILFLDALDQLSETNNARNLIWLPSELPEHVHLVVSTLPGECLEALEKKLPKENIIELESMPSEEGEKLLELWLEDAGRTLQTTQREEVISKFQQNGLPLYLKLAFEEARRWKSYTERYELSPDISGIIQDLFSRLSSDADHGEMMVSHSLGYIAAAKNGLSEDELLDLLSKDKQVYEDFTKRARHTPPEKRIPVVVWSRLYFDLEPYLTERSADGTSLMTFYHPTSIGNEVIKKFLSGKARLDRHLKLAHYFREQPLAIEKDDQKISNLRKLSELPYQQARANLWEELVKTLTDFNFLEKKARAVGPWLLIDDYTEGIQAGCKNKDLLIVQEALRLSAHVLINDPDQIAGQLIGRLLAHYPASFKSLINQATQWRGAPWFCPLQSRLIIPGGPLHCTLTGHTGTVLSLALTSDGNFAVSGGADGTLRLWDLKQWKLLKSLKLPSGIGEQVSTRLTGSQIYGGLQEVMGIPRDVPTPNSIALTRDSRFAIFSIAGDKTIWIWDIIKDELAYILKGHLNVVFSVAVTLDGKYVVSGGADGAILLWNLNMAREKEIHPIHAFIKHSDMATSVAILDDGLAVSGSMDKTIRVWDIEKRKLKRTIHTGRPILGLAVVPNTQRVASFSLNAIDVWDINKPVSWMKSIRRKGMLSTVAGFKRSPLAWAVTPDGSRSITYCEDEALRVSDLKKGELISDWAHNIYDLITSIVVTPDGNYALTGSVNQTISVWNLRASANIQTATDHKRSVRAVAITSDEHLAVSGSLDGQIKVWDLEQKKVIRTLDGHTDAVMSIAIIPDGRYAVSGSRDKTVRVWDLNQGIQICNLSGHHNSVNAVAITKNGRYAVSGSRDNTVKIWDIKKKECLKTYNVHEDIVGALAMTMDGTRMITVSSDETMRIWDLNLGKNIENFDFHKINEFLKASLKELGKPDSRVLARHKGKGLINTVAMTQDGKFAVTGGLDGSVKVWDVNEMKEIHTLQEKSKSVWSVAITPEGKSFLLSTEGPRLKLWDMESWKVKACFNGDNDFLSCAIMANGVICIAGDANGQVHIFRLGGLD